MYIAVYLRYHVLLLVNINIFYMTPQRATWKNSYYMLNVLPSLNEVLLLLLLLLIEIDDGHNNHITKNCILIAIISLSLFHRDFLLCI